jgi:predicted PurR-regulated permease PerM
MLTFTLFFALMLYFLFFFVRDWEHMLDGIVVIAGGTLVIGLADNFLRPILVGHETKMPDYLVLLSTCK